MHGLGRVFSRRTNRKASGCAVRLGHLPETARIALRVCPIETPRDMIRVASREVLTENPRNVRDRTHFAAERTGVSRREPVIVEPSYLARNFWLLRRAVIAAAEDNCFSISKGAAYSFLLSLFPVLTTMAYLLIQAQARQEVGVISMFIREVVPPGTEDLLLSRLYDHSAKPISLSVVTIIISVWAGSGAMMSLMEGFQAAYRIPAGKLFLKQRAMAIFLVFIAAMPAVLASALIIFGARGEAGRRICRPTWMPRRLAYR